MFLLLLNFFGGLALFFFIAYILGCAMEKLSRIKRPRKKLISFKK
jgi:hypothetical protein